MRRDLTELLRRVVQGEVECVLIGGFAVVAHGCSLVTRDVDVAIALEPGNVLRLWNSLKGLNPRYRGQLNPVRVFTEEDAKRSDWKNIYLQTDLGPLDCLGEVKGVGRYHECLARSTVLEFDGLPVRILDRPALIEAKLAVGRPHDLLAVNQLRIIGGLDSDE